MNRETQDVLLMLLGGAMVKIAVDGSYLRYVKASLHPYLLIAGVFIIVLAIAAIIRDVRRGNATDGSGHAHSTKPYWMLLVPIGVILFVAPPALGASSIAAGPTISRVVAPTPEPFPPLPTGPAPIVSMVDLAARAARDSNGTLDGRRITVSGFVVHTANGGSPRLDGSRSGIDLARIVIVCCIADARTVRVHLAGPIAGYSDGTWLSVQGTVVPHSATVATGLTPTLTVTDVQRIDAPHNTYEY